jgi:DNA gyrase subunit A
MGRATQGVRLITLKGKESIAAVAKIEGGGDEDEEYETIDGETLPTNDSEE